MRKEVLAIAALAIISLIGLFMVLFYVNDTISANFIAKDPLAEAKKDVADQMRFSNQKLVLVPSNMFQRAGELLFFGVFNTGDKTMYFKFDHGFEKKHSDPGFENFKITSDEKCHSLKSGQVAVYDIGVIVMSPGKFGFRGGLVEYAESGCKTEIGRDARYIWINYNG